MKWIGQHIWDLISRFRSEVYLESLDTSSEGNVLVVDSDGKVTVNPTVGGGDLTIANATDNRVVTSTGGYGLNAEELLTFDGATFGAPSASFTSYVTISNGSTTGQPAFYINNLDADQSAIKIEGANNTGAIIDIDASALSTGSGIYINDDTYERAVGHIRLDITDTHTTTLNRGGYGMFQLRYEKPSGSPVASGQTLAALGANIRMDDNATNVGTFSQTGLSVHVDSVSTNGTITNTGITTRVGGGDTT